VEQFLQIFVDGHADCLLAEVLQSVACNTAHDFDARLVGWLLSFHDRIGHAELAITQGFIAKMLGVQRTYAMQPTRLGPRASALCSQTESGSHSNAQTEFDRRIALSSTKRREIAANR
jgi:hypothetical protein